MYAACLCLACCPLLTALQKSGAEMLRDKDKVTQIMKEKQEEGTPLPSTTATDSGSSNNNKNNNKA